MVARAQLVNQLVPIAKRKAVDFDSAIPRFESWRPSHPVRSLRGRFLVCENRYGAFR
jgi:hypothetical protein